MKKLKAILSALIMGVFAVSSNAMAAGGIGVSTGSLSMTTGGSASFTVSASNAAGRVDISSSNSGVARVSIGSVFLDNSSSTVTVTGVAAGTATITIRATDMTTYDDENITGATRTVSVTVNAPAPAPNPTPTPTPTPAQTPASTTKPASNNTSTPKTTTPPEPQAATTSEIVEEVPNTAEEKLEVDGLLEDSDDLAVETTGEEEKPAESSIDGWMIAAIIEAVLLVITNVVWLVFFIRSNKKPTAPSIEEPSTPVQNPNPNPNPFITPGSSQF